MAQINGFPRLCLESLLLKDSSVFIGTAEFRNCVTFTPTATIKGGIKMNGVPCIDEFCNIVDNGDPNQVKYAKGYVCGFEMSYDNSNEVTLEAGACRDYDDSYNICTTESVSIEIGSSGAGGLDTGSQSYFAWYAVHIIADSSGQNSPEGMFSLSADSPTMPEGYDVFRRVGWVRNTLGNFLAFKQKGNGKSRTYCYDTFMLFNIVLGGGRASKWTTVSFGHRVPSTSCYVYFQMNFNSSDDGDDWAFRPTGSEYGGPVGSTPNGFERAYAPKNVQLGFETGKFLTNEARQQLEMCVGYNRQIDYASGLDSTSYGYGVDIFIAGYEDEI
jgi:hypothetical protein